MDNVIYQPIGILHSPYKEIEGMPIQPCGAVGVPGTVELNRDLAGGLKYIDEFSHLILVYHLHLCKGYSLEMVPFLDDSPKGIFATRVPKRPNPIGISIVKLIRREGNMLHVENVDVLDNTPLLDILDIKPYVSLFDIVEKAELGWYARAKYNVENRASDVRFKE